MDQIGVRPVLVAKGAEAELYLQTGWRGMDVLLKKRVAKAYRIPELDRIIREYRTIHEADIISKAKRKGVCTPSIYLVDLVSSTIYMQHVRGQLIRSILPNLSLEEKKSLFIEIGRDVGKLHEEGIVHGDLTTSNMILTDKHQVCFLDFGLAEQSEEMEKRGVDIHLMKHMLVSTHYDCAEDCLSSFVEGYLQVMGQETTRDVIRKVEEIERRGRYVAEREILEDDHD